MESHQKIEDNKLRVFTVRRAMAGDMKFIHEMIQELADFESMSSGPQLTVQDLIRDSGIDGGREYFHCYIVESPQTSPSTECTPEPVGYSICFFSYSTWKGKCYFMEDIYIKPQFRNLGVGKILLREVAKNAKAYGCKRVDFHVLGWNPARRFYDNMGGVDLTESEDWHYYRLAEDAISKLAK